MNDVKADAGTPPLFYCKPVNDKGGPCHASDCDLRSGCMLQMKRQQHTKDGKTVTHQDHFRCTITCGYCGKRRHYEDECHIKKRESDKLKRQEAERQKTQTPARNPPNGDKGGKGGGKGGCKNGPPNPQRRSSAPVATPTPAATPARAAGDPKKRPQGDNATPEGNNSKKRRLAWMAKSLIAAGNPLCFPLSPAVSLNLWSMKGSPMGTSFSSAPKRKPQYHEPEPLPSKVTHKAATRTPKRGKKTPHRPLIQPAMRPESLPPPQPFFSPSLWDFFQLRPPPEPPPSGVTVHT